MVQRMGPAHALVSSSVAKVPPGCLGNGRLRIALPWTRRRQVLEKVEDLRAQSVAMMAAAARQAR